MAGITVNQLAQLTAGFKALGTTVEAVEVATKSLAATVAKAAPQMKADMASTGTVITQVAEGIRDVTAEWQDSQIQMLLKLKDLIIPFEGSDAGSQFSFDKIIDDQIAKIRAGTVSAGDAIRELQREFGSVYSTLQNQFFGSQDPATQRFLLEIETFINSGWLNS